MGKLASFLSGCLTVAFVAQAAFAEQTSIVNDFPADSSTIFVIFLIAVILIAVIFKYTAKKDKIKTINKEIEEEEAEKQFEECL